MKSLTDQEVVQLKAILSKDENRDTLILQLLFETGARASEILNLTTNDIDHDEKAVMIKTLKKGRNRLIPVSPESYVRLAKLASSKHSGVRLFPITYRRLHQIWMFYRPFRKKLHALRHRCAVDAYKSSKDIKLVQSLLGHRSLSATMVYTDFVSSSEEIRVALRNR